MPAGQKRKTVNLIPNQSFWKRWPLELTSSRKHLGHLIPHRLGHFPAVEASEARTVHFLSLQVTGPGGDPHGSRLPEPRVLRQAGVELNLARRSGLEAAQGRGLPAGSRQSAGDTERSWGSRGGAPQRGPVRGGGREMGGLPSRSRELPQRRKRRCQERRRCGSGQRNTGNL